LVPRIEHRNARLRRDLLPTRSPQAVRESGSSRLWSTAMQCCLTHSFCLALLPAIQRADSSSTRGQLGFDLHSPSDSRRLLVISDICHHQPQYAHSNQLFLKRIQQASHGRLRSLSVNQPRLTRRGRKLMFITTHAYRMTQKIHLSEKAICSGVCVSAASKLTKHDRQVVVDVNEHKIHARLLSEPLLTTVSARTSP
jgi:hypothetical protein